MFDLLKLIPQLAKSRTMLINIASLVAVVGDALTGSPILSGEAATITAIVNVANMVLRVLTTTSVFDKTKLLSSE